MLFLFISPSGCDVSQKHGRHLAQRAVSQKYSEFCKWLKHLGGDTAQYCFLHRDSGQMRGCSQGKQAAKPIVRRKTGLGGGRILKHKFPPVP